MLNSGVAQYPDARLYNSAKKLRPEDRPTVPVRLYDDVEKTYGQFGVHPNPNARAFTAPDRKTIYVNSNSPDYKHGERLAAMLAHEQAHVANGEDETQAYKKELDAALRFGAAKMGYNYIDSLDGMTKVWKKK